MFKKIKKGISKLMDNIDEKITITKEVVKEVANDATLLRKVSVVIIGIGISLLVTTYIK